MRETCTRPGARQTVRRAPDCACGAPPPPARPARPDNVDSHRILYLAGRGVLHGGTAALVAEVDRRVVAEERVDRGDVVSGRRQVQRSLAAVGVGYVGRLRARRQHVEHHADGALEACAPKQLRQLGLQEGGRGGSGEEGGGEEGEERRVRRRKGTLGRVVSRSCIPASWELGTHRQRGALASVGSWRVISPCRTSSWPLSIASVSAGEHAHPPHAAAVAAASGSAAAPLCAGQRCHGPWLSQVLVPVATCQEPSLNHNRSVGESAITVVGILINAKIRFSRVGLTVGRLAG